MATATRIEKSIPAKVQVTGYNLNLTPREAVMLLTILGKTSAWDPVYQTYVKLKDQFTPAHIQAFVALTEHYNLNHKGFDALVADEITESL